MRRKLRSNASTMITNKTSFFKVLQIGHFEEKLLVPPAFIKHFNGKTPDKLILQSPTGRSWTIKMKKYCNKELFFYYGWPEFVHAHYLQHEDFVVFKYKGHSKFHVKIYAKTGCEKELPLEFTEPMLEVKQEEDEETDEETYGNGYNEPRKSAVKIERKNGVVKSAMPRMSEHPHFVAVWRDTRKSHLTIPRNFAKEFGLDGENSIVLQDPKGRSWPVDLIQVADGRINMADRWAQFSVGNKLSAGDICLFQVINQTKVDELHVLIFLNTVVEKQGWEVPITRRPIYYLDPEFKTRNLGKRPMTIPAKERVSIKEANTVNSALMKIMKGDIGVNSAFPAKSDHPPFIFTWWNSRKYFMTIPRVFVRRYQLNTENTLVLQDPEGKLWPVKISLRKDGRIDMGKGWYHFSIGNRLSEGDACLFEFHNYTKGNTLNVDITKKSDFEKQGYSLIKTKRRIKYLGPEFKLLPSSNIGCGTAPAENRAIQAADAFKSRHPTCSLTKAIQAANAFKSKYPSFEVIMRPSYLRKGCVGV
ncbi:hypothetical protein MKW98_025550 [Papaver atlanticum]|uniref:TF-B3 domain-containing protein n=1 Tax=Papaver atlanticum TaxID=357466 RepID=A0AAD4SD17_9MAGN|nr:hypothetical protein MKW98_025550 [Papaver atlanticum]